MFDKTIASIFDKAKGMGVDADSVAVILHLLLEALKETTSVEANRTKSDPKPFIHTPTTAPADPALFKTQSKPGTYYQAVAMVNERGGVGKPRKPKGLYSKPKGLYLRVEPEEGEVKPIGKEEFEAAVYLVRFLPEQEEIGPEPKSGFYCSVMVAVDGEGEAHIPSPIFLHVGRDNLARMIPKSIFVEVQALAHMNRHKPEQTEEEQEQLAAHNKALEVELTRVRTSAHGNRHQTEQAPRLIPLKSKEYMESVVQAPTDCQHGEDRARVQWVYGYLLRGLLVRMRQAMDGIMYYLKDPDALDPKREIYTEAYKGLIEMEADINAFKNAWCEAVKASPLGRADPDEPRVKPGHRRIRIVKPQGGAVSD